MFKRKYLATNKEDETVDEEVVTVVVAAVVRAIELQSMFKNVWKIISNDLAYIVCKENV